MIYDKNGGVVFDIKIVPRSNITKLETDKEIWRLKITAPPVEGSANRAIIEFFARLLSIPKRDISIIRGLSSTNKTIRIEKYEKESLIHKITNLSL